MDHIQIVIMPWLSDAFGSEGSQRVVLGEQIDPGSSLKEVLHLLAVKYEPFGSTIFDVRSERVRNHARVVVNDRLMELLEGVDTVLKDGDQLIFLAAYSGG